jgi:endonuclease/exonuclease/phosphatase family metal-dependent hydrolase
VAYRTNAITRHGEHGNALLSRWPLGDVGHHDVSDHRFEQRGLLHVPVQWNGVTVHAVVVHFGLVHASRCARCSAWRASSPRGAARRAAGGGR